MEISVCQVAEDRHHEDRQQADQSEQVDRHVRVEDRIARHTCSRRWRDVVKNQNRYSMARPNDDDDQHDPMRPFQVAQPANARSRRARKELIERGQARARDGDQTHSEQRELTEFAPRTRRARPVHAVADADDTREEINSDVGDVVHRGDEKVERARRPTVRADRREETKVDPIAEQTGDDEKETDVDGHLLPGV